MHRRAFLAIFAGGLLAAPRATGAQQTGRSHRIGILGNVPPTEPYGALLWGAFIQGLRDHGYTEGQNIAIEHLYSEGKYERLVAWPTSSSDAGSRSSWSRPIRTPWQPGRPRGRFRSS
jgi:hypothetical protein